MVAFPDLHRESTVVLPVAALSLIGSGLLVNLWWVLAAVALVPFGLCLMYWAWLAVQNVRLRRRWARQFARRLSWRRLRAILAAQPALYRVHVRFFGGFDAIRLCPATVLEDRKTGDLAAVHPASWRVPAICDRLAAEVVSE